MAVPGQCVFPRQAGAARRVVLGPGGLLFGAHRVAARVSPRQGSLSSPPAVGHPGRRSHTGGDRLASPRGCPAEHRATPVILGDGSV